MKTSQPWRDALKWSRLLCRLGVAVGVRVTARRVIKLREVDADLCEGCGAEIMPEVCCCGLEQPHDWWADNHPFVPMGCNCMRRATARAVEAMGR